jgi:propanol-preferring alcohol dehydrogenase
MKKMAVVEWGGPLAVVEAETPVPTGAQVLLRTEVCGVCHTDVHVWDGYFDMGAKGKVSFAARGTTLPFTLGHEIVATVAKTGPDVSGIEVGKSYIVYPWIGCGTCPQCIAGNELMCAQGRSLGLRCDGGYADHVLIPDAKYLVPYDPIPRELACTFACSGITALSALKKVLPLTADDWLYFVGSGETLSLDIDIARRGGHIVLVGLFGGSTTIAPLSITSKVLRIEGSYVGTLQDLKDLVALARSSAVPPIPISIRPIREATAALTGLKTGGKVTGRQVLETTFEA